jgi:hypothetical protein
MEHANTWVRARGQWSFPQIRTADLTLQGGQWPMKTTQDMWPAVIWGTPPHITSTRSRRRVVHWVIPATKRETVSVTRFLAHFVWSGESVAIILWKMISHVPKHKTAKARFTLERATKAQRGLDGGGWSTPSPGHFTPRERDPVPLVQETGWTPGPVWTGAENLAPYGKQPKTSRSTRSWYKQTMGERATPTHTVHRYKQDEERPCRRRTLKPWLIKIIIIIIIIIVRVQSLQFLRSDNTEAWSAKHVSSSE